MYIIFIKFWLVISIVSFGTLINSNISAQTVENNPRDTWILDSSSGIPVWIALREKSGEGWRLLVYIEPHNYNVNKLRKVYSAFSKQYEDSYYISVKVFTSLNTVQDELTIRKIGLWNIEDLPDSKKSNIQEDVFTKENKYKSQYLRTKLREWFIYDTNFEKNIKVVLKEGVEKTTKLEKTVSNFSKAILEENTTEIQRLLDSGISINLQGDSDWTPLNFAIQKNSIKILKFLIQHGADLNLQSNSMKITPLNLASSIGQLEIVELLVSHGANLEIKDKDGETALMRAVSAGNFNVVTYLLKYGANPEVTNNKGETVLNKATNKKIVKLLLKKVSPDSN